MRDVPYSWQLPGNVTDDANGESIVTDLVLFVPKQNRWNGFDRSNFINSRMTI